VIQDRELGINPSVYFTEGSKKYSEQGEFDQSLLSKKGSQLQLDEFRDCPSPEKDSPAYVLPLNVPLHLIRRATKEFERGFLDERLVHKLLHLGRESPKFQQEYVRLRVESWLKPRKSFRHWTDTGTMPETTKQQESSSHALPLGTPLHLIRRATIEFERGILDELLIHKLLPLDRESAEFRQEYIRLRVESWLKPRRSSRSWTANGDITDNTKEQEISSQSRPLVDFPQLIKRAIKEFESGMLDEYLVHKLLPLNRESPEFRQEYIKLRVESLLRPRASSDPWSISFANPENTKKLITPEVHDFKNPLIVKNFVDLWGLFGPWLTVLVGLQLFCSFQLGELLIKYEIVHGNIPYNRVILTIELVLLITSSLVLFGCRGQYYKKFVPRLLGIGTACGVMAIVSFLLLKFF
jgi:hypothetical protein